MGRKGVARVRTFRADRPFIYLLRDTETNALVFVGRVSDPTAG
jgi:serine protease inhibitor